MKSIRVCHWACGGAVAMWVLAAATLADARDPSQFHWFPKAPPLPAANVPSAEGEVICVHSVDQLLVAAQRVKPGGTIRLAAGRYTLPRRIEINTDRVTLRGVSGHRDAVVLDGGPQQLGELVSIGGCSGVTIADLTIENARWNGFKVNSDQGATRLTIYNCVIHDVWQRGIKGPAVPKEKRDRGRPTDCRIQFCLFYNDRPKAFGDDPADRPDTFNGNYIGGIDAMHAQNWTISDNLFVGIRGQTREARGAIFLWHDSRDCLIERNAIVDCDAGICLGNSYRGPETKIHCTHCTVQNNFVVRCQENGIMADYTRDCRILHNTVYDPKSRLGRLIRLVDDNDGLWVANNLIDGPAIRIETHSRMKIEKNPTCGSVGGVFHSEAMGDLRIAASAGPLLGIIGSAPNVWLVPRLAEVPKDFERRPRTDPTLVGAAENWTRVGSPAVQRPEPKKTTP